MQLTMTSSHTRELFRRKLGVGANENYLVFKYVNIVLVGLAVIYFRDTIFEFEAYLRSTATGVSHL